MNFVLRLTSFLPNSSHSSPPDHLRRGGQPAEPESRDEGQNGGAEKEASGPGPQSVTGMYVCGKHPHASGCRSGEPKYCASLLRITLQSQGQRVYNIVGQNPSSNVWV